MEGILHVPPDRGTIIGRAIWKSRYVVVADPSDTKQLMQQQRQQSSHTGSSSSFSSIVPAKPSATASRGQQPPPRVATPRSPASLSPENMFLSVFKSKGDWEPIQQHAISSITDCQVQMLAHRKQGPVLPTLVINVSPDPVTDKLRKRRSSRTAGFTTTKETAPSTLWFRPAEDCAQKNILQDWCHFIQTLMLQLGASTPSAPLPLATGNGPLSPVTPASPTFVNPFASSQRGRGDQSEFSPHQYQQTTPQSQYTPRPGSGNNATGRTNALSHNGPNQATQTTQTSQTYSRRERERDRPKTYSESPSLRSRRSDLSHTSSNLPPHATTPGYSSSSSNFALPFFHNRPADLPSPATTVNEFSGDSVEGWTTTQGRSSTLSSPVRGRDSISSQPPVPMTIAAGLPGPSPTDGAAAGAISSSSPPAPRETILDRAFQMHFIPGSDRDMIPGENKLTSLARFDALMREVDERKRLRQAVAASDIKRSATTAPMTRPDPQLKSGWDLDDDSDESDSVERNDDDDEEEEEEEEDSEAAASADSDDDGIVSSHFMRVNGRRADSSSLRPGNHLDSAVDIAPNARRALDFIIAGRSREADRESRRTLTSKSRADGLVNYDAQTLKALNDGYFPSTTQMHEQEPIMRPQTGYARNRPPIAQRTHSQPQLAALNVNNLVTAGHSGSANNRQSQHKQVIQSPISPSSSPPLPRSSTFSKVDEMKAKVAAAAAASVAAGNLASLPLDKRQSASSAKRLSFNDFTRRLSSSTSSLLLVQTNTSSNSGSGGNVSGTGSVIHEGVGVDAGSAAPGLSGLSSPRTEKHGYTLSSSSTNGHGHGHQHSSSTSSRLTSPPAPPPPPPAAERCGWRSSVSVVSNEGGFV
ncbi:hypothetical protein HMPREF1624_01168 [Sporothrix schenckii ATCC 58251]|uniref:Uncharacterized protein n=1 Tax=Sporothrix schenckii (strain ATCC 58251 / de Perez 2211183) TaxID=1391915 RepID=U7Q748_SPOS1|nr:hypothetical protein HMPREF1624_01168 [Sporothrix schenckii ATCC 58251]